MYNARVSIYCHTYCGKNDFLSIDALNGQYQALVLGILLISQVVHQKNARIEYKFKIVLEFSHGTEINF